MTAKEIKKDFPILVDNNVAYLDNGATTQKPIQVINAITDYYKKYNANIHRGAYKLSIDATEMYENARKKIAKFINAPHSEEIIFTKNATESINLVARSFNITNMNGRDDETLISIMEHHSNLVPWQRFSKSTFGKLEYMYINNDFEITDEEIEKKITDKTRFVAITHVSNVTRNYK